MLHLPLSLDLVALKATLVLIGAMLVALLLRRASGSSRHTLWTATTVALLALPLLESNLPELPLAWLPAAPGVDQVINVQPVDAVATVGTGAFTAGAADRLVDLAGAATSGTMSAAPRSLGFWLGVAWLLGVMGFAAPVLIGLFRSRRVMASAREVHDDRLLDHFAHASRLVGVNTPVSLRISPAVRTPMTGGIMHPVVLLPETALLWSDDCTAAVLRHELVHVRQRDALRQLGSRLSVALYWFHPLAWRAARLGALAREMACDESVLRLGTRPSRYARHLLALADPLPAPAAPALVRLDHPHLEERVMAILRASPPPASRRLNLSAAVLILGWTAVVAAAAPTVRKAVAEERSLAAEAYPVELAALTPDVGVMLPEPSAHAQPADCENLRDSRSRSVSGTSGPVRMFTTDHEGTRICVTVRGDDSDRDVFIPRGRLPNGVVLTMGTSNDEGDRRLEIEGTSRGNEHRWFVDGRARPFDGNAAEWRDAMLNLVGVLTERGEAEREMAVEAMGVSRRNMLDASEEMRRNRELEARAVARARSANDVAARVNGRLVERQAHLAEAQAEAEIAAAGHEMERDAQTIAEVAEVHARAAVEARHADEVVAAGVGRSSGGRPALAPRSAGGRGVDVEAMRAREVESARLHARDVIQERRRTVEERRAVMREHEAELREHARVLEREHAARADEIRRAAPVISEGRGGFQRRDVPVPPTPPAARGARGVVAPRAVPSVREREVDPRALEAGQRLRRAIRATGET